MHAPRRQALCSLLAWTPLATWAQAAPEAPAEVRQAWPAARLVGQGTMRYFGLRIYDARLWAPEAVAAERYAQQPLALELVYARSLWGSAIAERSITEMRRQPGFDDTQAPRWLAAMKLAFPDVQAGERLVGLHDGQGRVRFWHNGRLTQQLDDRAYARLFFGIWLAPQTSAAELRASLLGLPG
ncbi:MAG: hypothetical protein RI907_3983 [Pseudomonadota bacterium]|jgi:hypothetical protein